MVLDQTMRGTLEQIIDSMIKEIPRLVRVLFEPSQKAQLHIQNEKDFALGIALGGIYQTFSVFFLSVQKRYPNDQESSEIRNIILRRTAELRDAIFSTG